MVGSIILAIFGWIFGVVGGVGYGRSGLNGEPVKAAHAALVLSAVAITASVYLAHK